MKLSTRVRYGLRIVIQLAGAKDDKPVLARELAEQQDLSAAYVDQILIPLRSAGIVRSRRGRQGGYFLGKPAEALTALQVMESVDGKVRLVDCLGDNSSCPRAPLCVARDVWQKANDALRDVLDRFTLAELSEKEGYLHRLLQVCEQA